jgi:hypothetical protein
MLDPDLIEDFEFDFGNLPHLLNRRIEPADVWDAFHGDPIFIEDTSGGSGDWRMVGRVPGDYLTIVVTESNSGDPSVARPITGWLSVRWEVDEYEQRSQIRPND